MNISNVIFIYAIIIAIGDFVVLPVPSRHPGFPGILGVSYEALSMDWDNPIPSHSLFVDIRVHPCSASGGVFIAGGTHL